MKRVVLWGLLCCCFSAVMGADPDAEGQSVMPAVTAETPSDRSPLAENPDTFLQDGLATWYGGKRWHGRRTASGERFDRHGFTAAHLTLPLGSNIRVVNPNNGREVQVRINDRGPFTKRVIIDLSEAAAERLGIRQAGRAPVSLHRSDTPVKPTR